MLSSKKSNQKKDFSYIPIVIMILLLSVVLVYLISSFQFQKDKQETIEEIDLNYRSQIANLKSQIDVLQSKIEELKKQNIIQTTPVDFGDYSILHKLINQSDVVAHVKIQQITGGIVTRLGVVEHTVLAEIVNGYKGAPSYNENFKKYPLGKISFLYEQFTYLEKGKREIPAINIQQGREYIVFLKLPQSAGIGGGAELPPYKLTDRWFSIHPYDEYFEEAIRKNMESKNIGSSVFQGVPTTYDECLKADKKYTTVHGFENQSGLKCVYLITGGVSGTEFEEGDKDKFDKCISSGVGTHLTYEVDCALIFYNPFYIFPKNYNECISEEKGEKYTSYGVRYCTIDILSYESSNKDIAEKLLNECIRLGGELTKFESFFEVDTRNCHMGFLETTNCSELKSQITTLINQVNYCNVDSDCIVSEEFGLYFGCYALLNKNADIVSIKEDAKNYARVCPEPIDILCPFLPIYSDVKCINNKCIDIRFKN